MSHETLGSVWHCLREVDDLGVILRDVVGNFILRSCRSNYHHVETPQRFLSYCLELALAFDVIRFTNRTSSQSLKALEDDLVSAVLHLLQHMAYEFGGSRGIITQSSYIHILEHTLNSAIWTLRTCTSGTREDLHQLLARASQKLLSKTPVNDERLWLIQTLVHFLSTHCYPDTAHGAIEGRMNWKMLSESEPEHRTELLRNIVVQATDTNIAAVERIVPALNLCQLYWDTDTLFWESYGIIRQHGLLANFFGAEDDASAVYVALSTRSTIQEQVMLLGQTGSKANDALNVELHVLFRPGASLDCAQDLCRCVFHGRIRQQILELHATIKADSVKKHLAYMHTLRSTAGLSTDFFTKAYHQYGERFTLSVSRQKNVTCCSDFQGSQDTLTLPNLSVQNNNMKPQRELVSQNRLNRKSIKKPRSASQPDITRQYSTTRPPMPRSTTAQTGAATRPEGVSTTDQTLTDTQATQLDITQTIQPSPKGSTFSTGMHHLQAQSLNGHETTCFPDETCNHSPPSTSGLSNHSLPPLTHSPRPAIWSMAAVGSTDSLTTATSSKLNTSSADSRAVATPMSSEKIRISPSIDLAPLPSYFTAASPTSIDKVYPEVATTAIKSVEPDNLSLFSEGESLMTKNSSVKPAQSRKWSTFLKSSKRGAPLVNPKARFSSSGKLLVTWTRHGGGYYDITTSEQFNFHPIHIQDIILACAGSTRYAVIARCHEGYTLGIYDLGHGAPLLRVNLNRQPAAMDISPNDQFVAIKYTHLVRVYDLEKSARIDHRLPKSGEDKVGPGGNAVTFAHDSGSFMASTRLGPEKVLTYWSDCMDKSRATVAQSTAPCGHMDDHGLTGLTVCGPSIRGIATGFLSTFTEKGNPVLVAMSPKAPQARPLRDAKGMIGTRIHTTAMHVDKQSGRSNLVLVNQNNDIFWVSDLFGRDQEIQKVRSLKRAKSMRPELLVSMSSSEEANIFWLDKGSRSGTLVKVGKEGGMIKVTEDLRLDIDPMCSP